MAGLNVGSAFATFALKTDGLDKATKKIESSLDVIEKTSEKATKKIDSNFSKINKSIDGFGKNIEAKSGAIAGITAVGTAGFVALGFGIKKTTTESSKLNESINAVQVIFEEASEEILEFGKISAKTVGLSNSSFNQLAVGIGGSLRSAGVPMDELAEQTIELTKRASDMASIFDKDVEYALYAIQQGLRGEVEAMRDFNSDVTDASIQQFALSKGIEKSVTQMTYQEKTLLRMEKIMADTNVTAGDFQNTITDQANQQRVLNATTDDSSAKIGKVFMPAIEKLQGALLPVIEKIGEWAEKYPELTKWITITVGLTTGLIVVVGGLALALAGLTVIATTFGISILPLILIIGGIVIAIGLLVLAGLWLWKNWEMISNLIKDKLDEFKNKYSEIFSIIEAVIKFFVLLIKVQFAIIVGIFKIAFDLVIGIVKMAFEFIKLRIKNALDLITGIIRFWVKIFQGDFRGAFEEVLNTGKKIMSNFVDMFKGWYDIGSNIVKGIWDGIKSKAGWIGEQISNFAKEMQNKFKNIFQIKSPSRVMAEIGENITAGLAVGMENKVDLVSGASDRVSSQININNNNQMSNSIDYNIFSQKIAFQVANSR